jgi:WXG100 family type VII secretion target
MASKVQAGSGVVQRIDTQAFDAAIQAMEAAQKALSQSKQTLTQSTDQLLSTWEGYGQEAFEKVYGKLKTRLNDEEDNLAAIRDDLLQIKQSYSDWDKGSAKHLREGG